MRGGGDGGAFHLRVLAHMMFFFFFMFHKTYSAVNVKVEDLRNDRKTHSNSSGLHVINPG